MRLRLQNCPLTRSKAGSDTPSLEFHAFGPKVSGHSLHSCFFILYVGLLASNYTCFGLLSFFLLAAGVLKFKTHTRSRASEGRGKRSLWSE